MILRKPYALLIKYFRLIHGVLLALTTYLLYRTNIILNFLQEYISSDEIITGKDFTGELFTSLMFSLPFTVIIFLLVLLWVMIYKKKKKLYYIYNIFVMIALLVLYNVGFNVADILEGQLMDTRTIRLLKDFYLILLLLQGIGVVFTFIRTTGFDIKKFDFAEDLQEMDITEEDREEFEVDVNFETNVVRRGLRRRFRNFKYFYTENKFLINIFVLILFSVVCFTIYMNLTIYNKTYSQNTVFMASDFTMSVTNSFSTNENYKGSIITDNHLVIVELDIKANSKQASKFNATKAGLKIKDKTYYPISDYNKKLIDLGNVYNNENISNENFQKILLVYEIPKDKRTEKMVFSYIDTIEQNRNKLNPKYIKVRLKPYDLEENKKVTNSNLNNVVKLNEMLLGNTNLYLTNLEISEKFKIDYNTCFSGRCYDFYEYLNPPLNTNYDKVLLKIEGILNIDKEIKNNYDLYTIINHFGKIKYQSNGQTNYFIKLTKVNSKKASTSNSIYVSIPKEVLNSDKISFIVDIRDKSYEYVIK